MERADQLQTTKELFNRLAHDGKNGIKRNALEDATTYLALQGISPEISFTFDSFPNKPTLVAVSHISRSFINSGTFITTVDSFTTAAVVSLGISRKTEKPSTWVMNEDLRTNFMGIEIPGRRAQLAMIRTYGFIGVTKEPQMRNAVRLLRALKEKIVCLCPEGRIGEELKQYDPMFLRVLDLCKRIGDYQIIPVSIWPEESKDTWVARFNDVITPQDTSEQTADLTMQSIALGLPWYMRGYYSGFNKVVRLPQAPQLQVSDQKQLLGVQ